MNSRQFFGSLLFAAGVLIASLSGLCSLGVVAIGLPAVLSGPQVLSNLVMGLVMVAMFGGLPFAVGVALIFGGNAVSRSGRAPQGNDRQP